MLSLVVSANWLLVTANLRALDIYWLANLTFSVTPNGRRKDTLTETGKILENAGASNDQLEANDNSSNEAVKSQKTNDQSDLLEGAGGIPQPETPSASFLSPAKPHRKLSPKQQEALAKGRSILQSKIKGSPPEKIIMKKSKPRKEKSVETEESDIENTPEPKPVRRKEGERERERSDQRPGGERSYEGPELERYSKKKPESDDNSALIIVVVLATLGVIAFLALKFLPRNSNTGAAGAPMEASPNARPFETSSGAFPVVVGRDNQGQ